MKEYLNSNFNFSISRKSFLSQDELAKMFEIIKPNMIMLGVPVTQKDYDTWSASLEKHLENHFYYFYIVSVKDITCGFVSLIDNNGKLTLCELQLNEKAKGTRVLINILYYLFNCKELQSFNNIEFSILKQNDMSNKTFSHLGGKLTHQTANKNYYTITRQNINDYFNKLNRNHNNQNKMK